jgi:hypothetical protein
VAISLVRKVKGSCSDQASLTIVINSVVAGNKLIVLANTWQGASISNGGIASITSSPSAVWRKDVNGSPMDNYTPTQFVQASIWSADAVTSGTHTVTINFAGSNAFSQTVIAEFSGLMSGAASLDISLSRGDAIDSPSAGITPYNAQAEELLLSTVAVVGNSTNVGLNPPPSNFNSAGFVNLFFDENDQAIVGFSSDYKILSQILQYGPQYGPMDGAAWYEWSASLASYKAGVAAGETTTVVLTTESSWTVPSNISNLQLVEAWGAGGSGGNRGSQPATGGGGGAYSAISNYTVTPGQTLSVSIGAGGIQEQQAMALLEAIRILSIRQHCWLRAVAPV